MNWAPSASSASACRMRPSTRRGGLRFTPRRRTDAGVTKAWLDINNVQAHGLTHIEEPEPADLPDFVQRYLKDNGLTFEHGTVRCLGDAGSLELPQSIDAEGASARRFRRRPTATCWGT